MVWYSGNRKGFYQKVKNMDYTIVYKIRGDNQIDVTKA